MTLTAVAKFQLETELARLRAELVELINSDYAGKWWSGLSGSELIGTDFIGLANRLKGADQLIAKELRLPLQEIRGQLIDHRDSIRQQFEQTQHSLSRRQQRHARQAELHIKINILEAIDRVTGQLEEILVSASAPESQTPIKQLERSAIELNQMHFLLQKSTANFTVQELSQKLDKVQSQLLEALESALVPALEQERYQDLKQLINVYSLIDQQHIYFSLIDRYHTQPFLQSIEALGWSDLLEALLVHCISPSTKSLFSIHGSMILKAFFRPFAAILLNNEVFSPIRISELPKNYELLAQFLSDFATHIGNQSAVQEMHSDPLYLDLTARKWPFSLFYQFKFKQISDGLESCLGLTLPPSGIKADSEKESSETSMAISIKKATEAALLAMELLWKDQITPMLARLWRLTIQIWLRHRRFCIKKVGDIDQYDDILAALNDLFDLPVSVKHVIERNVKMTGYSAEELLKTLDIQSTLDECVPKLNERLAISCSRSCIEVIKQLKNIPSQYRRTNKPVPTKPSAYVNQILKSARVLSEQKDKVANSIPHDQFLQCISSVAFLATQHFYQRANELLVNLKNVEESLRRLQQSKQQVTSNSLDALSDEDKIRRQIQIDIEQYGQELIDLKVIDSINDLSESSDKLSAAYLQLRSLISQHQESQK